MNPPRRRASIGPRIASPGVLALLCALSLVACNSGGSDPAAPEPKAVEPPAASLPPAEATAAAPGVRPALSRALAWLEAHPPGRDDRIGNQVLDLMAWYAFATSHPDPAVRERACVGIDRRLAQVRQPPELTFVPVSYWITAVRLKQARGLDATADLAALEQADLEGALDGVDPTTSFWIEEQMRRAGLAVAPDLEGTFVSDLFETRDYVADVRDAYRLFHELVPASDFGLEWPGVFSDEQVARVRQVLPGLIDVSRESGDPDAVAEAMVSAAILDARDDEAYPQGVEWLLTRQRQDGSFRPKHERSPDDPDKSRHALFVVSWALLTSPPWEPAACGLASDSSADLMERSELIERLVALIPSPAADPRI